MSKDKDSIGIRFKNNYEDPFRIILPKRMPLILRIDGKNFHSYTKGCQKPFDEKLMNVLDKTSIHLMENIQGAQVAYIQSDEISILIHNYKNYASESWLSNGLQKITSVTAGMASGYFTSISNSIFDKIKIACFDCRAFVLPENEVNNYFNWRQLDASRNSVSMVAQNLYSHSQLNKKSSKEMQEMIFEKNINWNDYLPRFKRGRCILRFPEEKIIKDSKTGLENKITRNVWKVDNNIPIFSENPKYIEKHLDRDQK